MDVNLVEIPTALVKLCDMYLLYLSPACGPYTSWLMSMWIWSICTNAVFLVGIATDDG